MCWEHCGNLAAGSWISVGAGKSSVSGRSFSTRSPRIFSPERERCLLRIWILSSESVSSGRELGRERRPLPMFGGRRKQPNRDCAGGPELRSMRRSARDKFRGISATIPNPPTSWPRLSGAIESGWDTLCRDTGRDIAKHHAPSAYDCPVAYGAPRQNATANPKEGSLANPDASGEMGSRCDVRKITNRGVVV